ncbi:uncharacterized protein FA14DRAFT_119655 [Meira miltonrushii]|uniref:Uncharacterized protein n=1 Tax=Meira miltonrushii TaxID=1280837 RepID=A0A316VP57_9BASI|nr:uncharacterized protein FA14DRAFT_119655 [Meira miltonrushii]PWN37911.1 hypothetical protein FA14DRAFT_119655 [Meira miltonrushii]
MQAICPALALPEASRSVIDADEEIFLLYTLSAPPVDRQGLGQIDGRHDKLAITISLKDVHSAPIVASALSDDTLTVIVRQDSTSLRSTNGDTGSVVWRSSVYFAAKPIGGAVDPFLLSPSHLMQARVLELGSGTGILPALILSHDLLSDNIDSTLHWIASDQDQIVPLLRKNVEGLSKGGVIASASAIDWIEASQIYKRGSSSSMHSYLKGILDTWSTDEQSIHWPDIIFATDCIFNPHLFDAFLDTLCLFTQPNKTLVYVVCELRQADMMQDFLQAWLDHSGNWTIHTIESSDVLGPHLSKGSVVWVAWREK